MDGNEQPAAETINLAVELRSGDFQIDREAGTLRNVPVITRGPAKGHGFDVDDVLIGQVAKAIRSRGATGVKSRLTHPAGPGIFGGGTDPIEVTLGRIKNARKVDDGRQVRADLHIGRYAANSPRGNLRDYILDIAEDDPGLIGLSIAFVPDEMAERRDDKDEKKAPAARLKELVAVDVVGDPAANPDGLLKTPPQAQPGARTMAKQNTPPTDGAAPDDQGQDEKTLAKGSQQPARAEPAPAADPKPAPVQLTQADLEAAATNAAREAVAQANVADRERQREIHALATDQGLGGEWALEQIMDGQTLAQAKDTALAHWKTAHTSPEGLGRSPARAGGDLNHASLRESISDALILRANHVQLEKPHDRAAEFRGLTIVEMGRQWLNAMGVAEAHSLGRSEVVRCFGPRYLRQKYPAVSALAQSTGDFDNILQDAQNKTLRAAYLDAPEDWSRWARRTTAPDFKSVKRAALSESPDLVQRYEGSEVKYVTLTDGKETYTLVEYAGGITLTRQAIINDDLDAFGRIPQLQANAARRKEMDIAWAVLTANANMADGTALFAAGHSNLTASGTAISVTSLGVAEALMLAQTGLGGNAILGVMPKFLLAPTTQAPLALQVITSTVDPALNNAGSNPYQNRFEVIPSPRLNSDSTTEWYLAADFRDGQVDTVEVCFLEGEEEPVLSQETDFDTDDQKSKVRHTVAAAAIDHRGLYRNNGA